MQDNFKYRAKPLLHMSGTVILACNCLFKYLPNAKNKKNTSYKNGQENQQKNPVETLSSSLSIPRGWITLPEKAGVEVLLVNLSPSMVVVEEL